MEEVYIGTKIIAAEAMTEMEFVYKIKGENFKGSDRPGYKVRYEDGYVSWSPKETFERAYRLMTDNELKIITAETPGY